MAKRLFINTFRAEAACPAYIIVKAGTTADYDMKPAAAATDIPVGIRTDVDTAINELGDVSQYGVEFLLLGGTVAKGAKITSDASGHGVAAATGNQVVGIAMQAGVAGDVIDVLLTLGSLA